MRISLKHWLRLKRSPWLKIFYDSFKRFKKEKRQARLLEYEGLNKDSVVLDFGGYEGNWAHDIFERYGCSVHVFEPHPRFADAIRTRFAGNSKIFVHEYALGTKNGFLNLSDDGDASSALKASDNAVQGKILPVQDFFERHEAVEFTVAKINIEGGEYDLLPALLDAGFFSKIRTLQIQFHLFTEEHLKIRDGVISRIEETHQTDWGYPFVWEQWTKR